MELLMTTTNANANANANEDDYDEDMVGWLPAEVWAMVCRYLATGDLARLSTTCWGLRSHALARVRHHTFTPLGKHSPLSMNEDFPPGLTCEQDW
jgi:hypothetical protein